jgi:aquaglyceroporin related protein
MILIIFGNGANCQVVLSSNPNVASSPKGEYLSTSFGWAVGIALGVWLSGGISGGHINPAVTLALATFRDFSWKKVPVYIISQLLGALTGATIVYWNYINPINVFEGGPNKRSISTASLFSTYAADYMTNASCFFSEFIATAVLLLVIMAINDKKNVPPPAGLNPLVLFIVLLGVGACLGMETGFAINPARDLGPRLMTAMVGYGSQVFSYRNQYWLWCPIIAPICGALFGTLIYDAFIFEGEESIFNKPDSRARARNIHASHDERQEPIAAAHTV